MENGLNWLPGRCYNATSILISLRRGRRGSLRSPRACAISSQALATPTKLEAEELKVHSLRPGLVSVAPPSPSGSLPQGDHMPQEPAQPLRLKLRPSRCSDSFFLGERDPRHPDDLEKGRAGTKIDLRLFDPLPSLLCPLHPSASLCPLTSAEVHLATATAGTGSRQGLGEEALQKAKAQAHGQEV